MKYDLVYVEWLDACSFDEWEDENEAVKTEPHTIHTTGWLIREDAHAITIAQNYDAERESVSMYTAIPTAWVIVKELIPLG